MGSAAHQTAHRYLWRPLRTCRHAECVYLPLGQRHQDGLIHGPHHVVLDADLQEPEVQGGRPLSDVHHI